MGASLVAEQTKAERMRALLAEADRHKRVADAAESIRLKMRLGAPAAVRRGALGWLRWTNDPKGHYEFEELGGELNSAVYEALGQVQQANLRRSREIEGDIA